MKETVQEKSLRLLEKFMSQASEKQIAALLDKHNIEGPTIYEYFDAFEKEFESVNWGISYTDNSDISFIPFDTFERKIFFADYPPKTMTKLTPKESSEIFSELFCYTCA